MRATLTHSPMTALKRPLTAVTGPERGVQRAHPLYRRVRRLTGSQGVSRAGVTTPRSHFQSRQIANFPISPPRESLYRPFSGGREGAHSIPRDPWGSRHPNPPARGFYIPSICLKPPKTAGSGPRTSVLSESRPERGCETRDVLRLSLLERFGIIFPLHKGLRGSDPPPYQKTPGGRRGGTPKPICTWVPYSVPAYQTTAPRGANLGGRGAHPPTVGGTAPSTPVRRGLPPSRRTHPARRSCLGTAALCGGPAPSTGPRASGGCHRAWPGSRRRLRAQSCTGHRE